MGKRWSGLGRYTYEGVVISSAEAVSTRNGEFDIASAAIHEMIFVAVNGDSRAEPLLPTSLNDGACYDLVLDCALMPTGRVSAPDWKGGE